MSRAAPRSFLLAALALLVACAPDGPASRSGVTGPAADRAGYDQPGVHRQYGAPVKVGDGTARAYVVLDAKSGQTPLELGIALGADVLEALPAGPGEHSYLLPLPGKTPAPYQLVELDWNPAGHPPQGVFTVPHFDFHFYTITAAQRDAIDPGNPTFAAEANNLPTGAFVPPFYAVLGPSAAAIAVPHMGVHWLNVRAPELQNLLGHPELYQPFTSTFIYGSWNGRFTFYEPMVTLAYLLSQPDVTVPISVPSQYAQPGYYATSYRVTYDAQTRQYLVALSGLTLRS